MTETATLHRRLPRVAALAEQGIANGLHPGLQVYVSRSGRCVVDDGIGQSAAGVPMSTATLLPWLSAGKPLTAVAILQLAEAEELGLDDPIAAHIPEFATNGKGEITIRHCLTHTAGLAPAAPGWGERSPEQMLERVCNLRTRHGCIPGQCAAYDPGKTWLLLATILERVTRRAYVEVVRDRVCAPARMPDTWPCLTPAQVADYGHRLGLLHDCSGADCVVDQCPQNDFAAPAFAGASWRGPAHDLGHFYEALLAGRLLGPGMLADLTRRHREGQPDLTFQRVVDFGLGVILNSNRYGSETTPYGFGRYCSEATFGHGGSQTSVAFADSRNELVVVLIANGMPGDERHQSRHRELASAVYLDLGLT